MNKTNLIKDKLYNKFAIIKGKFTPDNPHAGQWGVIIGFDGDHYHVSMWGSKGDDKGGQIFDRNELRVPRKWYDWKTKTVIDN